MSTKAGYLVGLELSIRKKGYRVYIEPLDSFGAVKEEYYFPTYNYFRFNYHHIAISRL